MAKKNLAVFFGGRTVEHDVSIVTGLQAMENIDRQKYQVTPVYIAADGNWYCGEGLCSLKAFERFDPQKCGAKPAFLSNATGQGLIVRGEKSGFFGGSKDEIIHIDAALLCMHGMHGEDGTLQGLLELCDIPYTSPGVAGSAAGMDKVIMKRLFRGCGFPMLDFVDCLRGDWEKDREAVERKIEEKLSYPVYVKPARLGSSIGITKVCSADQLKGAMDLAFSYDKKVLVEQGIANPMEINCSGLGIDGEVDASLCEKPLGWQEFLTFDDKYMRGSKQAKAPQRQIPADLPEGMTERIQQLTKDIFTAFDCKGVVRIDFLVDQDTNALYVNEINTIPGSLAFYLWEPCGMSYPKLIDRMVEIAIQAAEDKRKNNYAFDSKLIQSVKLGGGTKGAKGGAKR